MNRIRELYAETGNYSAVGRAVDRDYRYVEKWLEIDAKEKAEAGRKETQVEQTSQSKALKMLDEGVDPVRVAWETGLSAEEVGQVQQGRWKLKGMEELERLYGQIGTDGIWELSHLNDFLTENDRDIRNFVQLVGDGEELEEKVENLGDRVDFLENKKTSLEGKIIEERENLTKITQEEARAKKARDVSVEEKKRTEVTIANLQYEEIQLEAKVGNLDSLVAKIWNGEAHGNLQKLVVSLVVGFLNSEKGTELRSLIVNAAIHGLKRLSDFGRVILVYHDQPVVTEEIARRQGYNTPEELERVLQNWLKDFIDEFDKKLATSILGDVSWALLEYAETHASELSFEKPGKANQTDIARPLLRNEEARPEGEQA